LRALRVLSLLFVVLAVSAPVALAQTPQVPAPGGGPFSPLPPPQPAPEPEPEPTAPTNPATNPNDDELSTLAVFGLFAAGILVIVLIGFLIMRDARRSLPRKKRKKRDKRGAPPQPVSKSGSGKRPPPRAPRAAARKRRRRQKRRAR
jgi:hypothetical protein